MPRCGLRPRKAADLGGNGNAARRRQQNSNEANQPEAASNANSASVQDNADADKITPPTSPVLPGQTRIVWTLDENKRPGLTG